MTAKRSRLLEFLTGSWEIARGQTETLPDSIRESQAGMLLEMLGDPYRLTLFMAETAVLVHQLIDRLATLEGQAPEEMFRMIALRLAQNDAN